MPVAGDVGARTRSLFAIVPNLGLPLSQSGRRRRFPRGTMLMKQGDYADAMFLLVEGSVRVTRTDPDLQVRLHLADLGAGEVVGEIGVLSGNPRNATVTALTDIVALEFGRGEILHGLHAVPGLSASLQQLVAKRLGEIEELESGLRSRSGSRGAADMAGTLAGLMRSSGLSRLKARGTEVFFPAGEVLMYQGDAPDALYLIDDGFVRVERTSGAVREPIHVADLGPGEVVGEMGVLTNAPRNATVTALTNVDAVQVFRADALSALLEVPGLPSALQRVVQRRMAANEALAEAIPA